MSRRAWAATAWLILALALAACRSAGRDAAAPSAPMAPVAAVKLAVEADGIYEAPAAALQAAGFDLTAGADDLVLTHNGEPVGFMVDGQGRDQVLRFYGRGPGPDAYSNRSIYWLGRSTTGGTTPARIPARAASPSTGAAASVAATSVAAASVVSSTVHVEEQLQYNSQSDAITDRWVWQTIFAPAEVEIKIAAPHAADAGSLLRLRLLGISSAPTDPDHHLILSVNGVQVSDSAWDGLGEHVITATLPAGAVRAGDNALAIRAAGDTGAPADSVLLDWAEITYARELTLDAGDPAIAGDTAFAGEAAAYTLNVPAGLAALWDITDPDRPAALSDYSSQDGVVRFASDGSPRRFIAATPAGLRSLAAITPVTDPGTLAALDAWPGGADMIIVTVPQFRAALKPLVEARQAQGLRVALVDVDQVYDGFSHGQPGPEAIRGLVQHARAHWTPPAPRFLLLAGDASYDPRGYLKGTEIDLVPTQEISTSFSGWTASDVWYGLADDSPTARPAIAVGRFPAQTADQLATMVAKTLDYEGGDRAAAWRNQAILVADGSDPSFPAAAKDFAGKLSGYTAKTVASEGDGSAARQDLLAAFDQGVGLVGYFGHGSVTIWAKEKVFGVEDVAKLTNRDRLPLVFTITCLSGFFQHPNTPSLGETLLRAQNGGAAAALVPSSAAVLGDQNVLADGLADALAAQDGAGTPETLGDAVLRAQSGVTGSARGLREVLLTFNLLGDPAVTLRH